jgi:hypothetical protein
MHVNGSVTLPPTSSTATFDVYRLSGSSATLPFTLISSCGIWLPFVDGGPDAW